MADIALGVAVFAIAGAVFLASRVHQIADSQYSMLVSQSLLDHRSFALDGYAFPGLDDGHAGGTGRLYQLERVSGHTYYWYPPGSSVLSVPYVALMNAFGVSAAHADGTYDYDGETSIETGLAALLA